MAKRHLTGLVKMDIGKTIGVCSKCHAEFASGANRSPVAQAELKTMFDAHTVFSAKKKLSSLSAPGLDPVT
jgi:hypothetical protein